jgi:hypothetical protein
MTTYRFVEVAWPTSKRLSCSSCGKKIRRQTTFSQTLNPFNRNAEGQPKTRQEILAELRTEAAEWEQTPEQCTPCWNGGAR